MRLTRPPSQGPVKIKTSVTISLPLIEAADKLAKYNQRSRSYIIDEIIAMGLKCAAEVDVREFSLGLANFNKALRKQFRPTNGRHDSVRS